MAALHRFSAAKTTTGKTVRPARRETPPWRAARCCSEAGTGAGGLAERLPGDPASTRSHPGRTEPARGRSRHYTRETQNLIKAVEAAMPWNTYYTRKSVIDAVLADVDADGSSEIPPSHHEKITKAFARPDEFLRAQPAGDFPGKDEFLLALHYRWANTLTTRLDPVLESPSADDAAKVQQTCQALAREQPATARLLAAYASRPSLASARRRHQRQLSGALGTGVAQLASSTPGPARAAA